MTARRIPELLFASARLQADGSVAVLGPGGEPLGSAEDVGEWLGRPVELRAAGDEAAGDRLYENVVDPAREDGAWESFRGASGAFHDSGEVRVSLVSTASLDGWDRRRFRANVVFDVDFNVSLDWYGAVVFCIDCIKECITVAEHDPVSEIEEKLKAKEHELEVALHELTRYRTAFDNLNFIRPDLNPFNVDDGDESVNDDETSPEGEGDESGPDGSDSIGGLKNISIFADE